MRVAFVGKGGAGKSSLAGTCARLLGRQGRRVLALDSDPMPGLAFSLGVGVTDSGLPDEAVEEFELRGRRRYRLCAGLSGPEAVERYATRGPDGVRFLQLGKARGPRWDNSRQHFGFQGVLDDLPDWDIVGDLPGGTRQPFFAWGRYARTLLVVADPAPASLLTGRRLSRLAATAGAPQILAVANRVQDPEDARRVAEGTGLTVVGAVPLDSALGEADRDGRAVLDMAPDSPAVGAVRFLVEALQHREDAP